MTDTTASPGSTAIDDGLSLKARLARATRRQKLRALALVAPLGILIIVSFLIPIAAMLVRSVHENEVGRSLHRTAPLLKKWDGKGLPGEEVWAAFVADLKEGKKNKTIGKAATKINFAMPGTRSILTKSARKVRKITAGPYKEALIRIDKRWNNRELWLTIRRLVSPVTFGYYLNAVDMKYAGDGSIVSQPEVRRIYLKLFKRTLLLSLIITILCVLLGYPVAYLLATLPMRYANLLMILVLLPFWTSLLVRTTAWIALLQKQGVINDLAVWLHIISDENRLQMMFNSTGTVVAMTHILLPFMILPLYSVMKTIPPSYMRAARSMGAAQFTAYRRVYIPQTLPGVGAGAILVFILSIGFYITPALVGGRDGQLISNIIAYHMEKSLNWELAAALSTILLFGVLALYWLYNRIVGVDNMKLG